MASTFQLPEEVELARLEREQEDLEEQVASAHLALETIKNETTRFQKRYSGTVGRLYARIDELDAQIAEIQARQNPRDSALTARAQSARKQARRSSEEAGLVKEEIKPSPEIDPALKLAYRKAVKLMHPDLALSDRERQRRTGLMALLNRAYELGDLREIERLIEEFGQDPDAIVGEDVASCIVKAIRRIAQLRRRLVALQSQQDAYRQTELFQLRQTIEKAEAAGKDPLGDLAKQLAEEISGHEATLSAAKAARKSRIKSPRQSQQSRRPSEMSEKEKLARAEAEYWAQAAANPNLSPKAAAWPADLAKSALAEETLRQKALANQEQQRDESAPVSASRDSAPPSGAVETASIAQPDRTSEGRFSQPDADHSYERGAALLWELVVSMGRAIDKILTGVGATIQFFIYVTLFILFVIYVLPIIELLVYAGGLLWLAGGLIVVVLVLLHEGWKRLTRPH